MPMRSPWLFIRLAVQNLTRRRERAFLLALAVAVGGGALFTALILREAMEISLATGLARMGADLLVVPAEANPNITAALLTIEPTPSVLSHDVIEQVASLPGIERVAPQRYHALAMGSGSHDQQDLIAFDPAKDFTIIPWLQTKLDRPFRTGDLIVGGRRDETVGASIRLGNQSFIVYGKLALTGVGPFEHSLFAGFETVMQIAQAVNDAAGRQIIDTTSSQYSGLLVRTKLGATPAQIRFAAAAFPHIKIVSGNSLYSSVRQSLATILSAAVVLTILMLASTTIVVGAMYSGLLAERRRELGLFLAIGLSPGYLVRMILAEATLTTGLGGVCGVILGIAGILLFERSLGFYFERSEIPFSLPATSSILTAGILSVILTSLVGVVGVLIPAWRASRSEPYELVRAEA